MARKNQGRAGARRSRLRLLAALAALVLGSLTLAGATSAWTMNLVQLDNGTCGTNLQTGSDKTASLSATPSFWLQGDGAVSRYAMLVDGVSIGASIGDGFANVCIYTPNRLSDGVHVLTGNEVWPHPANVVTPLTFSVDTVRPPAPSVPTLASYSDSGVLGDHVTRFRSVAFTGTSEAGASVALYNGTAGIGGTRASASGDWSATTSPLADGTYSVTAAVFDAAGNKSPESAGTPLTIDAGVPTVSITRPAPDATVSGTIDVTATASDSVGIWKVDFQLDGVTKATDTTSPYSLTWDSTAVANGLHTFSAVATDLAGNATTSTSVSFTVANGAPPPPTVPGAPTLNSATAGNASVSLAWSAPASNGGSAVTSYKLYRGTSSGGETLLTTLGNVTSFTDTPAANGTTYFYVVSALNAVGESVKSNERSATLV